METPIKTQNVVRALLLGTALLALLLTPAAAQQGEGPAGDAPPGADPAAAPRAAGYALTWSAVDAGGVVDRRGGAYTLGATAGQPDAATWSSGAYTLLGGFWGGGLTTYRIYLPVVLRHA
jgi:hypothetical protein